jgi:hypothetical protein
MQHKHSFNPDLLETVWQPLKAKRFRVGIYVVINRLLQLYMFGVVIMFLTGIMANMPMNDGFFAVFKFLFYGILFLILAAISAKRLENDRLFPFLTGSTAWLAGILMSLALILGGYHAGSWYFHDSFFDHAWQFLARWVLGLLSVAVAYVPMSLAADAIAVFDRKYKQQMIPKMLAISGAMAQYRQEAYIEKEAFEASGLFRLVEGKISKYSGSDMVEGISGGADYRFSALRVLKLEVHRTNKSIETKEYPLFEGIMLETDFHKDMEGEVLVYPDDAREGLGEVFGEALNSVSLDKSLKLALMEDPVFEKHFRVLTSDDLLARYVLSPLLMERMVMLKEKLMFRTSFSFKGGKLSLFLHNDRDLLGAPVFTNAKRRMAYQYLLLHTLTELPAMLGMDTRIWTKA